MVTRTQIKQESKLHNSHSTKKKKNEAQNQHKKKTGKKNNFEKT